MTYVPSGVAVVGLGSVVPALAVAAQEKNLVLDIAVRVLVQLLHLVVEALPLSERLGILQLMIRRIGAVDETKVDCGL